MAFTLQPAIKDYFINLKHILNEMISTLTDKRTRRGLAFVGPKKVGRGE